MRPHDRSSLWGRQWISALADSEISAKAHLTKTLRILRSDASFLTRFPVASHPFIRRNPAGLFEKAMEMGWSSREHDNCVH
jgi:hypothetical protein